MNVIKGLMFSGMLLITGCTTSPLAPPGPQIQHNVSWPDPIQPYNTKWVSTTINDDVYVAMKYTDSVDFRIWLADVLRYTKDLKTMVCYYRPEDDRCVEKPVEEGEQ